VPADQALMPVNSSRDGPDARSGWAFAVTGHGVAAVAPTCTPRFCQAGIYVAAKKG